MARIGKCPNYAGCILAYRNEPISVSDAEPFVCPECKQTLSPAPDARAKRPFTIQAIILGGIALLVVMGAAAVYMQAQHLRDQQPRGQIGTSFEQAQIAAERGELLPARHLPSPPPSPAPAPAAAGGAPPMAPAAASTPISSDDVTGVVPQSPNLDLQDQQNQMVKTEVLKRIDLMPSITEGDKDKLYLSVERARQMGKILVVPFDSGGMSVTPLTLGEMRAALLAPALRPLLDDPTCVMVILGFADMKGDEKTNLHISGERARAVMSAMRDKCDVKNVMHAVGMGGSTLFGNAKDAVRNRVVEVWAVLP